MHSLEEEIIKHLARTLFVSTYADACDNGDMSRMLAEHYGFTTHEEPDGWYYSHSGGTVKGKWFRESWNGPHESEAEAFNNAAIDAKLEYATASAGADWMDVAPETPFTCYLIAAQEVGEYLGHVKTKRPGEYVSLLGLLREAALADKLLTGDDLAAHYHEQMPELKGTRRGTTYAEEFGHCLAMSWMGHGISWFDDHEDFDLPDWDGFVGGTCLEDLGFTITA